MSGAASWRQPGHRCRDQPAAERRLPPDFCVGIQVSFVRWRNRWHRARMRPDSNTLHSCTTITLRHDTTAPMQTGSSVQSNMFRRFADQAAARTHRLLEYGGDLVDLGEQRVRGRQVQARSRLPLVPPAPASFVASTGAAAGMPRSGAA